jgi:fatty-acyl-CoA synthase
MTALEVTRELVFLALERHGSRPAVVADGVTWSYDELRESALRLASVLMDAGVRAGDPVAIVRENSARYLIADLAIIAVGGAKVPVNMMLSDEEVAYILHDSRAKVVLASETRLRAVERARGLGADPVLLTDAQLPAGVTRGPGTGEDVPTLADLPPVEAGDRALIMYTGGTTGRPKGVVHHQRGVTANLLSHVIETEITAQDRLLLTSPLPHSAGVLAQTGLLQGAVIHVEAGFDLDLVLERIEKDRVSYLFMVPTMIYRMLDEVAARPAFDSSSLRTVLYGASPITEARLRQGLDLFGPVFMQLFGQTEAPNFLTRLRREDHSADRSPARLRSCGQSVLMAQIRTVRSDGSDCAPGEVGEVLGRAPYVMEEYLGKPEATAAALRDGWLCTGDLGYLDEEGYLFLVDRKKDMIITGGLNVYAGEVEQALASLDDVKEAAVVGVPHPDWGEAVVAFVVPATPDATEERIARAARTLLSGYKRPKEVVLCEELPVTAVGKVDKKQLRLHTDG